MATTSGDEDIIWVLLRGGADPNLTNKDGLTTLHFICNHEVDGDMAEMFFKINDEIQQTVQIDARDNLGRTPLQLAVSNFLPNVVDISHHIC
uniref:Uncharacterized protein n=1 Tax=Trichogramma kaykai TaxID=54128 RepID=A0ABD2WWP6_9HYME